MRQIQIQNKNTSAKADNFTQLQKMDQEKQKLLMIKLQSRRIVEKAYNKSQINKKYEFPKKQEFEKDSQMSDLESLRSRVSEFYDLNKQNSRNSYNQTNRRTILPFDRLLKEKKEKTPVCQGKMETKSTFFTSNQSQQLKTRSKRKYLSLTPSKSQNCSNHAIKSARNIQKQAIGIQLTTKELQFQLNQGLKNNSVISESHYHQSAYNARNLAQSVIQGLQKFTSKCFNQFLSKQIKQTQRRNEAVFYDNCKIEWSKQNFLKKSVKRDFSLDQVTLDSTPNVVGSNGPSCQKVVEIKKKYRNQQLKISPFRYF